MERAERERIQALLTRLADGDRSAFDPAFQLLWPIVLGFSQRALRGSGDVDDAAQGALLKVFEHAARFDAERDAVTWVLGIAAYECKTLRRRQQRRNETPDLPLAQRHPDPSPEDELIARDLEAAALAMLGSLAPSDAETLHAMIADGPRGASPTTFRKRLQRALVRLRVAWSSRHGAD